MSRTQIYLEKSQLDALRREAAKRRLTVSAIIRGLIRERLYAQKRPPRVKQYETLLEAADRIGKMGKPGPRDLASKMDDYLYGGKQ